MHPEPHRITANEARSLYLDFFDHLPRESVAQIRQACQDGTLAGKDHRCCIHGNAAMGAGYNLTGLSDEEAQKTLREFGWLVGVEIKADGHLDKIEQFCAHVILGDTSEEDSILRHIEKWCDEDLSR